jgi:hypothetical protein
MSCRLSLRTRLDVEVLESRDCPSASPLNTLLYDLSVIKPIAQQINNDLVSHSPHLVVDLTALSGASGQFLADLGSATDQTSKLWTSESNVVVAECLQTFRDAEMNRPFKVAIDLVRFDIDFLRLLRPLQKAGGKELRSDISIYLQAFSGRVWALESGNLPRADRLLGVQESAQEAIVKDLVS